MTFADNLVRLRREKGFSQEQLADWMDVSRQAVSKWEAGQTMPDLPKLDVYKRQTRIRSSSATSCCSFRALR